MTFKEAYTSLLNFYKKLMFPEPQVTKAGVFVPNKYSMKEIDEMDVKLFDDLTSIEDTQPEEEVYLSDIW